MIHIGLRRKDNETGRGTPCHQGLRLEETWKVAGLLKQNPGVKTF